MAPSGPSNEVATSLSHAGGEKTAPGLAREERAARVSAPPIHPMRRKECASVLGKGRRLVTRVRGKQLVGWQRGANQSKRRSNKVPNETKVRTVRAPSFPKEKRDKEGADGKKTKRACESVGKARP